MIRSTSIALVIGAITAGGLSDARADEPAGPGAPVAPHAGCDAAFEAAELCLRPSDGRLLDARVALLSCALPHCQSWMVSDCTKRLVEVEARIPSVVLRAQDGRGSPVHDVSVFEGDRELVGRLDGRALEMDPGPHELVAKRGDAQITLSLVVLEGRKAQQALLAFPEILASSDPPSPAALRLPPPVREAPLAHSWARPLAGGLLLAGLAATGIGVGYGIDAIGKKHDARCDAANLCDGPLDDARDSAHAATIGFVVGGGLVLAGVGTFLIFGRTRAQVSARGQRGGVASTW